jgi:hypothetical protein
MVWKYLQMALVLTTSYESLIQEYLPCFSSLSFLFIACLFKVDLMRDATTKSGGIYVYANQQGCDGGRLYFDGCAVIFINGELVAQGEKGEWGAWW